MPYTPDPLNGGDVLRVTFYHSLDAQRMLTVLHARVTTPAAVPYITDLQNIAEGLTAIATGTTGIGAYREAQEEDVLWESVRVQRVSGTRDVYFEDLIGVTGGQSSVPAGAAPPNSAMTLNKRTLRPDRHGHGDMHLFGFPAIKSANGLWDPTLVANMQSVFQTWLTTEIDGGSTASSYKWCIYDPTPTTGGPQDVVNVAASNKVKTMHRRTVGLGE